MHAGSGCHKSRYAHILIGVVAGIVVGHFWPAFGMSLRPLGDGFVKMVNMMIAPIVFCTISLGISSSNNGAAIVKTLAKAMSLFYALTALALAIGLASAYLFAPGVGMNVDAAQLDPAIAARFSAQGAPRGLVELALHVIPRSLFGAFAEGEVLPVLLLSILFGLGIRRTGLGGEPLRRAIDSLSQVLFTVFGFIMRLAPAGAFGAMAFTIGKYGINSISSLGMLILSFYAACLFFILVVLGALARIHGFSLLKLLRYFREELLVVLGTSSSESVLPRMLIKLESLGCKKEVSGMVLSMGYSFNLDGTAIYLTLASVFIAQACNIHLSFGQTLTMLLLMLLTSKGAAGVTGSGFMVLVTTLSVTQEIPVAGVALIFGIDRFMSEARGLTSLISNAVSTIVVSIWERSCDLNTLHRQLDQGFFEDDPARLMPALGEVASSAAARR